MVVAELMLGTIIVPRTESPEAISRLTEFEWFHKIETQNDTITPEIDDLLLKVQKLYQTVDEVVKGLQIPSRVGIMEILFKGLVIKRNQYELDEIASMINDLEKKSHAVIDGPAKILEDHDNTKRSLEEYTSLKETLEVVKKLNVNLNNLGQMRYFYTNLFVINSSDFAEISRTLEGVTIFKYELDSKLKTAIIVFTDTPDSERVLKVLRSFNANPFIIPQGIPQNPSQAYSLVVSKITELTVKEKKLSKEILETKKKIRGPILSLHEASGIAKDVLEKMRKPGGTKRFAVIQGYIPRTMEKKFIDITKRWMSITEEITDPKILKDTPILFANKAWTRTFEVITESQGIPKHGEADPTPMIAIMWPIFYGIMFADFGHGILLMLLGLLFKFKGQGTLAKWGMLIAISGGSAAFAGILTGEAFGFHLETFTPVHALLEEGGPLHSIEWLVGIISVSELNFDQVIRILKVSIFLGIVHLVWAFILHIRRLYKRGDKFTMFTEAIPTLVMFGGVVVIMMTAIGSGYDIMNMYSRVHDEPVPWVTILVGDWARVWIVARIAIPVTIGCMAMIMVGGILHNKRHPGEGGSIMNVVIEVLLVKTVELLSHTISYARIGIMLLVHAALLLTVNNSYHSMGGAESVGGLALIIGGNLGIMMIEGLIVYIQSLRLHLYEFFTKWYDGGGKPFKKIAPEMLYNQLLWKKRD